MVTRRIVAVDDDAFVLTMLARILGDNGFEVYTAPSALTAAATIDEVDPDLALIDVHLGSGPDGVQLGRRVAVTHPSTVVVFLSRFADPHSLLARRHPLPAQASMLAKSTIESPEQLVAEIDRLLRGGQSAGRAPRHRDSPLSALTRHQAEVLRLAAAGLSNTAIAEARHCSVRAVEQHLHGAYRRLDIDEGALVNARVDAVRLYLDVAGPVDRSHDDDRSLASWLTSA